MGRKEVLRISGLSSQSWAPPPPGNRAALLDLLIPRLPPSQEWPWDHVPATRMSLQGWKSLSALGLGSLCPLLFLPDGWGPTG